MKRLIVAGLLVLAGLYQSNAQYPLYTIRQIQEVSADSLRMLDTLQRSQLGRWTAQTSPRFHDTVRVRGVCVVPAKVINFTSLGYNFLIASGENSWGGLLVRPNISSTSNPGDTVFAIQWGMLNVEPGDTVQLTGYIDEFPLSDLVSATQIVPVYSQPLAIFPGPGPSAIPPHVPKLASDFWRGPFPSSPPYPPNGIQFSTGEPMEFMRVVLTNLSVVAYVNQTNGTFQMVDQSGNMFSTMDASKWFTTRGHRDPLSTYALPPIGSIIDTIRGYIVTNSGQEAARGYRIAPIYPGDIRYGSVTLPIVNTHRRYPVVVPPDSTPTIACRITKGNIGVASRQLRYSINNGPFVNVTMTLNAADTTYRAQIPQQAANTFVHYYISVTDSAVPPNTVKLASSATDGSQTDTLRGFFFYTVLNRPITISDIQTTPYPNGRTPYLGAVVPVRGIITADTASLIPPPPRFRGTSAWYMQNGNQPWSGIWVYNDSTSLAGLLGLRNGDSVAVTGVVAEDFDVTRVERQTTPPVVYTPNNPLPAPVVLPTSTFGASVGNGTPTAERWEGMLVQFNNVVMPDSEPTFQDINEFAVDDGSGVVLVRKDGTHRYTTTVADTAGGRILIRRGQRISYIRGVIYFAGGGGGFRYKLVPRSNADFGVITGVDIERNPTVVDHFSLAQNYPNPFNPATTFRYSLPFSEFVTVKIYNLLGQEVETLVNEQQQSGEYTLRYDASRLTSGVYFYQLRAGSFSEVRKMLLLK
ncbi:MAG TPA: hypothetical protein DGH68_01560 [Bacteroidetes bacterium]|nr:hypothetical protein [Bacteroidota bacterium]